MHALITQIYLPYLRKFIFYLYTYFLTEGDTLKVRFFTAFCNHWHCTSLQPLHLRWFSHCFATIDNFYLVFLQWLKKPKNNKTTWQDPTLCHYSPPFGVCNLVFFVFVFVFFVFCFFVFLVSWFIVFWFVVGFCAMAKQNQNQKNNQKTRNQKNKKQKQNDKTQLSATTPPFGVCNLVFLFFLFFLFFVFWFVVGFCAMVKQNPRNQQNQKNQKMTRPNSLPLLPPLGCAILFFFVFVFVFFCFLFFGFLVSWCFSFWVSWFLVFWFVVGFLKGWQNNTKVKDLDFTLCQFSHFRGCKLAFGWFYWLLWACGSNRKPCKKNMAKCRYHWRKLGGLGTQIRQFCLFM